MEFQRERVFTSLNADELRAGDKVIVADTLDGLKHKVQEGKDILVLQGINPETWGRRFSLTNTDYALAYLVERAENCTNCGNQYRYRVCDFPHHDGVCDRCEFYEPKTEPPELISLGNGQYVERKHTDCNHCEEARKAFDCRPFTIREAKEYILQNWFDGADDVEASIPVDKEYKVMKLVVRVLELAEKICGVEE